MSLIKVKNVTIINPSLSIDNFEVSYGDIIHLQGDSGVGKSSFFKVLTRLKKMNSGEISYNGNLGLSAKDIRDLVIYIPQFSGTETSTVNEYIKTTFLVNNCSANITKDLEDFEMSDIINKRIDQISGGERQVLNLLMAMSLDRKVLLCDESFSAIDPKRISMIVEKLLKWKDDSRAIVYVAHQELELDGHRTHQYLFKKTQDVVSLSKI